MSIEILTHNFVHPGFEGVRDTFLENFRSRLEVGASCVIYHKGKKVVDISGGVWDQKSKKPYQPDDLQVVFSSTKVIEALVVAMLVDRGKLDYDSPIATYWPEFAQNGKGHITVRQLMKHQAGLVNIPSLTLEDLLDLDKTATKLAAMDLFWVPRDERKVGADPTLTHLPVRQAYHALSRGLYVNELVRRVDGRSLGTFTAEEIAKRLGVEFYIGLPQHLESRVVPLIALNPLQTMWVIVRQLWCRCCPVHPSHHIDSSEKAFVQVLASGARKGVGKPNAKASTRHIATNTINCLKIMPMPKVANSRLYHQVESPSSNGITNARAIAKIAALLANRGELEGVRLLSQRTFDIANEQFPHPVMDESFSREVHFCTAGWGRGTCGDKGVNGISIPDDNRFFESFPEYDKNATGWGGAGGSMFLWNPDYGFAIGFVMNRMGLQALVDRPMHLRNAFFRCLRTLPN